MLRFLLPAFALASALLVLFAGALSDHGSYKTADTARRWPSGAPDQAAVQPDSHQPPSAASQPGGQAAQQQPAPELLQRQVQTLQDQATALQQQLAQRSQELDQQTQKLERRAPEPQTAQADTDKVTLGPEPLKELQHQGDDGNQQQLATRSEEPDRPKQTLDQHRQQLDQRNVSTEAGPAEAERLRQVIDALRQQNKAAETNLARRRTEEASLTRQQQAKPQQLAAKAQPQLPAPPMPAAPAAGFADAGVPVQQPPVQQLMTARQWLAAGRPDEARRLLARVQTQLVLQPVTPDAPEAGGTSASAGEVGNAIRWLDIGAPRQAMQAINKAIDGSSGSAGPVRAWSGYPAKVSSGYSQPYGAGTYWTGERP
jgi:hypothetical protein